MQKGINGKIPTDNPDTGEIPTGIAADHGEKIRWCTSDRFFRGVASLDSQQNNSVGLVTASFLSSVTVNAERVWFTKIPTTYQSKTVNSEVPPQV